MSLKVLRFGVDVREACSPQRTGKGQWTYGFVSELLERDVPLTLFTNQALPDSWNRFFEMQHAPHRAVVRIDRRGAAWHWTVALLLRASTDIDVYVSPTSYIVPSIMRKGVRSVPVIHDLIAFRGEPHDFKATAVERLTLGKAVRGAAHVCTVSQTTKIDLLARFPFLSPASVSPIYAGPAFGGASEHASDGRTILCIATLCPRKNQKRLIEAYASLPEHLRSRHRLVLVGGRGWKDGDIIRAARETAGVEWKEYLPDDECSLLLREAVVLAFPSLYEGFGMPVLDAFARGVPVLTSDRGSLREIAGDAALMVNPEDVHAITVGLQRLLEDAILRDTLSRKGRNRAAEFTWPKTVDLFLEAMQRLV